DPVDRRESRPAAAARGAERLDAAPGHACARRARTARFRARGGCAARRGRPMTPPQPNLSVIGPVVAGSTGAVFLLVGAVLLTGRKTFLGRKLTESYIGVLLAGIAIVSLVIATYMAGATASEGGSLVFDVGHPMFQLDPFSALVTAVIGLAALLSCLLSMHYL